MASRPRPTATTPSTTNRTAIIALVLSVLGVTSPIGVYLAYRARTEIAKSKEYGFPYTTAALWVGYAWIVLFILALLMYFWVARTG